MQKVGLHLRFGRTALSDLWVAHSPYVKALDDVGLLAGARGLRSLRLFTGEGNQQYQGRDPSAFADQMIARANDPGIILEPTNECGDDDIANFLAWLTAFTHRANGRGYAVAGFSFAEGHPGDLGLWLTIAHQGFCGVQYLAQHNYWPGGPPFDPYHALRHELAHQVLAQGGFANHPPWLLTEVGHLDGWATAGLNANQAAAEVVAYDQHLAADPSVAGAALYTRGGAPDFWMFETDPLAQVLFGGGGDPCAGLVCPPGATCQNGQCVGGGGDPCAGVVCGPNEFCQAGTCVCPAPYQRVNGVCGPVGGGGSVDASTVASAALVGGVLAGVMLLIRRQIAHEHRHGPFHPLTHPLPHPLHPPLPARSNHPAAHPGPRL